jgi:glyoxylase-like metal-dependent hydrolase (beta-lactamase superfamily II)
MIQHLFFEVAVMRARLMSIAAGCVIAAALVATLQAQRGPIPTPIIREGVTEKISDHVYVIPDGSAPLIPNVSIIVGNRATFVVDTGIGTRNAEIIMREVKKVSKNAELYLATTHIHPEHDLGAHGFPPSTKMVRSNDQVKEIAADGLQTAKRFAGFSPAVAEMLQGAEFRTADVVFDKEQAFDLGGVRIRAIAMGFNHTAGDTAFFVEPDGVLISGDVAMSALPGVGGNSRIATWLASMDRFEKLQPKRIVPSHGPMGDVSFVTNYRTYLTTVRNRTAALKKEGKNIDDTVKTVQDELEGRYDRNRMANAIRAAYNEAP